MTKANREYWLAAVVGIVLGLSVLPTMAFARNPNPGVLPLNSHAFGMTYGEWSVAWWQWGLSIPAATNPILDTTGANCAEGQAGHVWFLAGTFGGPAVIRTCTVPTGRALFFPLLNAANGAALFDCEPTNPGVPCVVSTLRALAAAVVDSPTTLEASVDGVELRDLTDYRVQSPVFTLTLPVGNGVGVASGTYAPQVSDGFWLMLAPLSAGKHTIHFKSVSNGGFEVEVTYNLTIK